MSLHKIAKQLESKGRHGDTMLMHIQPTELQILEAMLGKTTINPETGLPEAFSWKKLLIGAGLAGAMFIPGMQGLAALGLGKLGVGATLAAKLAPALIAGGKIAGLSTAAGGALEPKKSDSDASEAGKYKDKRTDIDGGSMYKLAPPMTTLQSISDRPDILGRQTNYYRPRVSPMGHGFPGDSDQFQGGVGYAQGGQVTEAQAKETVLAMLARMQEQPQPQPMAHGRMVQGGGTGLSDSIPARLSVDEYVIPADVVSMMGDGSSQAGGKRLDALVAQVRQAKTGTKKQAKPLQKVVQRG